MVVPVGFVPSVSERIVTLARGLENLLVALESLEGGNDDQAYLSTAGALQWFMFNRGHRRLSTGTPECGQLHCELTPGDDPGTPAREWTDHRFE